MSKSSSESSPKHSSESSLKKPRKILVPHRPSPQPSIHFRAIQRVKKALGLNTPVVIIEIVEFLREVWLGTAPELCAPTEEWREYTITSSQYTRLLQYLNQEEQKELWQVWQRAVKFQFNWMAKKIKLGPLGARHQYITNSLGPFIVAKATTPIQNIDSQERPLCGGALMIPGALVCWPTHPLLLFATSKDHQPRWTLPDVVFMGYDDEDAYLILEVADSELWGDLCFSGHEYLLRSGGKIRHFLGLKMNQENSEVTFGIWGRQKHDRELRNRAVSSESAVLMERWIIRNADGTDGADAIISIPYEWFVSPERAALDPQIYKPGGVDRTVDISTREILRMVQRGDVKQKEMVDRAFAAKDRKRDVVEAFDEDQPVGPKFPKLTPGTSRKERKQHLNSSTKGSD